MKNNQGKPILYVEYESGATECITWQSPQLFRKWYDKSFCVIQPYIPAIKRIRFTGAVVYD
jgi:hypothetical protein